MNGTTFDRRINLPHQKEPSSKFPLISTAYRNEHSVPEIHQDPGHCQVRFIKPPSLAIPPRLGRAQPFPGNHLFHRLCAILSSLPIATFRKLLPIPRALPAQVPVPSRPHMPSYKSWSNGSKTCALVFSISPISSSANHAATTLQVTIRASANFYFLFVNVCD